MEMNEQQNKYIEGWLQYKELKKYELFWFVLKAQAFDNHKLVKAFLFCFLDQNTHDKENYIGSHPINLPTSSVTLVKKDTGKNLKYDFVIRLNERKFHFRASDELTRERWIFALCKLVGKQLPPAELPTVIDAVAEKKGRKSSFTRAETLGAPLRKLSNVSDSPKISRAPIFQNLGLSFDSSMMGNLKKQSTKSKHQSPKSPKHNVSASVISDPFFVTPPSALANIHYYYGKKLRMEAESMLHNETVGTFMLRDSESHMGRFTLTYKDVDCTKHHMILPTANAKYQFQDTEIRKDFKTLNDAVSFYMNAKKKLKRNFHPKALTENERGPADGAEKVDSYLQSTEINLYERKPINVPNGSNAYNSLTSPSNKKKIFPPLISIDDRMKPRSDYKKEALPPTPEPTSPAPPIDSIHPPCYPATYPSIGEIGRSMTAPANNAKPVSRSNYRKEALPPTPEVSPTRNAPKLWSNRPPSYPNLCDLGGAALSLDLGGGALSRELGGGALSPKSTAEAFLTPPSRPTLYKQKSIQPEDDTSYLESEDDVFNYKDTDILARERRNSSSGSSCYFSNKNSISEEPSDTGYLETDDPYLSMSDQNESIAPIIPDRSKSPTLLSKRPSLGQIGRSATTPAQITSPTPPEDTSCLATDDPYLTMDVTAQHTTVPSLPDRPKHTLLSKCPSANSYGRPLPIPAEICDNEELPVDENGYLVDEDPYLSMDTTAMDTTTMDATTMDTESSIPCRSPVIERRSPVAKRRSPVTKRRSLGAIGRTKTMPADLPSDQRSNRPVLHIPSPVPLPPTDNPDDYYLPMGSSREDLRYSKTYSKSNGCSPTETNASDDFALPGIGKGVGKVREGEEEEESPYMNSLAIQMAALQPLIPPPPLPPRSTKPKKISR